MGSPQFQGKVSVKVALSPFWKRIYSKKKFTIALSPFLKGVFSKRKEFAPFGSKFFLFRVDSFSRGGEWGGGGGWRRGLMCRKANRMICKFFPFKLDPFSEWAWCARKQTRWPQGLSPLYKRAENIPDESTPLIWSGYTWSDRPGVRMCRKTYSAIHLFFCCCCCFFEHAFQPRFAQTVCGSQEQIYHL